MSQAVALAPDSAEVIFSRGFYTFYFGRDWRDAGRDFHKAVACNPQSSIAHAYMAIFHAMTRHTGEAAIHVNEACRNDPLSAYIYCATSCALQVLGQSDRAAAHAEKALELQPNYVFGLWMLGVSLCSLGRRQEAVETLERVLTLSRTPMFVGLLGLAYHLRARGRRRTPLARVGRTPQSSRVDR